MLVLVATLCLELWKELVLLRFSVLRPKSSFYSSPSHARVYVGVGFGRPVFPVPGTPSDPRPLFPPAALPCRR